MWAKNLSQMYSMLVCLVTCMVLMVSLTIILISVVNISFPETKNAKELARYASNEVFLQSFRNGYSDEKNERLIELKKLPKEELASLRILGRSEALGEFNASAVQNLIDSFLWFFVAMLFFVVHWSLYRRLTLKFKKEHYPKKFPSQQIHG